MTAARFSSHAVRSFVLRQGRMSPAQTRAYETLLPHWGVAYQADVLDLDALFGRSAPKVLEIGSGMGETTAAIALAQPDTDFLAVEVHTPGVGALLKRIERADYDVFTRRASVPTAQKLVILLIGLARMAWARITT